MNPNGTEPRVILIGDSGVGKTSIIGYAAQNVYPELTRPTIGAAVTALSVTVDDEEVPFHVWDTAGQEIYRSIVPLYFKGAVAAIVVFSIDDPKSFRSLNDWIAQLHACTPSHVPAVIVANKCDLPSEHQRVDIDQAAEWASSNGFPMFKTSARTGTGIKDLLAFVAKSYVGTRTDKLTGRRELKLGDGIKSCC